ncbi:tetratricopeptide repeat protein [Desulfosarcina ovata]|nr:tetratricopeptide repeat protein [Desulfosarcina ovata]
MKTLSEMYKDIQPLIDNGWNQAAVVAMEQLLLDQPNFAQGYHDLGELYLTAGEKEKAGQAYHKAVDLEPQNHAFIKGMADYYHVAMENTQKALALYLESIEKGGGNAEVFFIAANLSLVAQRFDDAIALYQKVLEEEPWHAEAFDYLEKVKAHVASKGDTRVPEPEAEPEAEQSADALYEKACGLGAGGQEEAAIGLLEKLISLEPENGVAHNDLGVYYHRSGQPEKSIEHYQIAVKLDPLNSTFQKNLADFLCYVRGDYARSLPIYLRLLKEDPEDVEVLMAAGDISQALGRLPNAAMFFRQALENEPWSTKASEKLEAVEALMDGTQVDQPA